MENYSFGKLTRKLDDTRTNNARMSDAEVYDTRTNNARKVNANADGRTMLRENLQHAQIEQKRMTAGDRIFLQSVIKRQKLVIQDLCHLNEFYPNVIDKDVIGGLFSLFCLLDDGAQSSEFSDRH
ncbi:MAG: hypothetical protein RSB10_04420 [Clostridia bacterium]